MNPSFLIDTDGIIHYLNGNPIIVERLGLLREEGRGKGDVGSEAT